MSDKPQVGRISDQDQAMRLWMHQNLLCLTRGSLSCFASVQPEKVLIMLCLVTGQLMSELYAGDEVAVHRFRKTCRDMFDGITKEMPVVQINRERQAQTADISAQQQNTK